MKVESDITRLKLSLDKVLDSSGTCSEALDILNALELVPMTLEFLRSTKVGKAVANVQKKFESSSEPHKLAATIVSKWKLIVDKSKKEEKKTIDGANTNNKVTTKSVGELPPNLKEKIHGNSNPKDVLAKEEARKSAATKESIGMADQNDDLYNELSDNRRKIMEIFANRLSKDCTEPTIAKFLGYKIEKSVYDMFEVKSEYSAKVRSLAFNLKQNNQLRIDIVEGDILAENVVQLSQEQMATKSKKEANEKNEKDAVMNRRSDYFKIARDDLCRDNGINPDQAGQFTCRKCGGSKTSHYQMQTRSADEPMTVFVCCLKCGNRWRE